MSSLANLTQEVLSALFLDKLRTSLVAGDCVDRRYTPEAQYQESVKIPSIADFTVDDYTKDSSITYGTADAASQVVYINQQKSFAKSVDLIDDVRSIKDVVPTLINAGAYGFAKAADTFLLQSVMLSGAGITAGTGARALGTSNTPISVYSSVAASGAVDYLGRMSQRLDEADVPVEDRFAIVPPWFSATLVKEKVLTTYSTEAENQYTNGRVGRCMGFDIRTSTNLTNYNTTGSAIFAGHRSGTAFVDNVLELKIMDQMETKFGRGARGLYVFGGKVVIANCLALGRISQG